MTRTSRALTVGPMATAVVAAVGSNISAAAGEDRTRGRGTASEVLDWNQIFIDTLIATNTANAASPRLGAIVHTAIFDAFNGIEQRYTPMSTSDANRLLAVLNIAMADTAFTTWTGKRLGCDWNAQRFADRAVQPHHAAVRLRGWRVWSDAVSQPGGPITRRFRRSCICSH
jgi:hypothetical protein